jgi:hypothetical protein
MNLVIAERIMAQDVDHLIEPFRHKQQATSNKQQDKSI